MTLFSLFFKFDPFSSMPGQQTTQFNISSIHGNLFLTNISVSASDLQEKLKRAKKTQQHISCFIQLRNTIKRNLPNDFYCHWEKELLIFTAGEKNSINQIFFNLKDGSPVK